jgi:hypothetical protein
MSGLFSPTQLGRSTVIALAAAFSILCDSHSLSANAALPLPTQANAGGVSTLGNNTAWVSPAIPRGDRRSLMDRYNSLSAPAKSVLGLLSFGSFGLIAAFRPLDTQLKRD